MNLPFTADQFLEVFEQYNRAVWPAQIFLNLLALGAIYLAIKPARSSNRMIAAILAFLWLWLGLAYHLAFFTSINPAAYAFAGMTIVQGAVFLWFGVLKSSLAFAYRTDVSGLTGVLFILYALIIYPALGYWMGHVYPKAPTFGLPCPTTIFTFGMLLWTVQPVPKAVLVVPALWAIIGLSAAIGLGIREDFGLLVAGLVGTAVILFRDRNARKPAPSV
jgi:Family of unknown function (DUF6064)